MKRRVQRTRGKVLGARGEMRRDTSTNASRSRPMMTLAITFPDSSRERAWNRGSRERAAVKPRVLEVRIDCSVRNGSPTNSFRTSRRSAAKQGFTIERVSFVAARLIVVKPSVVATTWATLRGILPAIPDVMHIFAAFQINDQFPRRIKLFSAGIMCLSRSGVDLEVIRHCSLWV